MDDQVTALLRRAANVGGDFVAPDVGALATRGRRRALTRTALAVAGVVILIAGLAAGLHFAGNGPSRPVGQPTLSAPSSRPSMPSGPSLAALEHGRWSSLPKAPITSRIGAATAWTGSQLLIWGGIHYGHSPHGRLLADGAAYTPATHRWETLPKAPLSPRTVTASVWTGSRWFVWGGWTGHDPVPSDGATYDPATHEWQPLPQVPITGYQLVSAVAVDGNVVLITSRPDVKDRLYVDEYDPATNQWTALPDLALPAKHDVFELAALTAGDRVFVWSLWARVTQPGIGSYDAAGTDGYVLDPGSRIWTPAPIDPEKGMGVGTPLWTGTRVLLAGENRWCGPCRLPPQPIFVGTAIDPATGTRVAMAGRPVGDYYVDFVWTGSFVIGMNERSSRQDRTAVWDPRRNGWSQLPSPPHKVALEGVAWTGHSVLAWTAGALLEFAPRR